MASAAVLKAAKKQLRTLMKQKLSSIPAESIDAQSAAIFKNIIRLEPYQEAKRICVYLSMPMGEVQTDAIVRNALSSGKQVFVPHLHKIRNPLPDTPRSVMDMVDLRSLLDYESLERDSWGIPTINAETVGQREHILKDSEKTKEGLDLILMPGVAFQKDESSGFVKRLGHGKGFYDYFLHKYRESRGSLLEEPSRDPGTDVLLYGLALKEQFLENTTEEVPVGEHDSLLHGLVIGDGSFLECASK
ncbi:nagb/rpia/CoA transferase-like protein [Mollisia scopiformis]|uniref:5-formyltetrahydrofolate cyclo-ligase n=1 Tax=Mollisia scopiformis TaxID=149040 RepID=A0A132BD36_MOLSC|nr:nagb/rpia/CoA transferase-like protein [Mollisia scopiformis]KUJ10342.1 nagb/rpia/CoA transferase-like protein [Mollisia scopiformis]